METLCDVPGLPEIESGRTALDASQHIPLSECLESAQRGALRTQDTGGADVSYRTMIAEAVARRLTERRSVRHRCSPRLDVHSSIVYWPPLQGREPKRVVNKERRVR